MFVLILKKDFNILRSNSFFFIFEIIINKKNIILIV